MKNIRKEKGITLIALVITIIVLLILAGVAISMLSGENGILTRASDASEQTKKASTDEQVKLAVMSALTVGNGEIEGAAAYKELNDGLKDAGYTGEEITSLPKTITINGTEYIISGSGTVREASGVEKNIGKEITGEKAVLLDANNEQIVVPVGFKIKEDSRTEVKGGIVVVAPDESEFVWVPVKEANTMYGTDENGNKLGKLYEFEFTSTGYSALNWTETDGVMSWTSATSYREPDGVMSWTSATSYREPDYLSSTTYGDAVTGDETKGIGLLKSIVNLSGTDEEILTTWKNQLQKEYNEMIESVKTNKGFYVGRYETSLNTTTKYAQSISGETSATAESNSANTWYGLYQKQKEYSTNNNITNSVGSSMIWGSQYDQMMIWMQSNNIDVTSNNPTNLEGTTTSENTSRTTGSKAEDKLNNIYDLLGNSFEWSLEAHYTYIRIVRGGVYDSSDSPSHRNGDSPNNTNSSVGSRLTLYVK